MGTDIRGIAIIGAGNLGTAIAGGILAGNIVSSDRLVITRRRKNYSHPLQKEGVQVIDDNREAIKTAELVFLCVLPKQVDEVLTEIGGRLQPDQTLISVVTGVSIQDMKKHIPAEVSIIRAMPNTAIAIKESMTCIAAGDGAEKSVEKVRLVFETLGETLIIEERLIQAATVLGASGIAFFMRYLRAATQGGIQMGFHPEEAQKIAVQTAKGAASLVLEHESHPELEIDKVTTPQGCTIEGLNEMEHQGFSSSLIKGLMTSYHKINTIS
jgi:pyrroline-5-carboxylate reductase